MFRLQHKADQQLKYPDEICRSSASLKSLVKLREQKPWAIFWFLEKVFGLNHVVGVWRREDDLNLRHLLSADTLILATICSTDLESVVTSTGKAGSKTGTLIADY